METNHEERNNETLDESVLYPPEVVTMMTANSSIRGRRSVHSSADADTESKSSEEEEFILSVVQGRIAHAVEEEVSNTPNIEFGSTESSAPTSQAEEKKEPLQQISATKERLLNVVDDLDRSSSESSESSEDFLFDILQKRAAENQQQQQQIGESSSECSNLGLKKKVDDDDEDDDDNERETTQKEKNMEEAVGDRGTPTCTIAKEEEESIAVQSKDMMETTTPPPSDPLVRDVAGLARTVSLPGAFHSRPSINGNTPQQPHEAALISDSVDSATLATDAVSIIGGAELVAPGEELVVDPEGGYALHHHQQQEEMQGQQREEVSELFEATVLTDSDTQGTSSHSKYNNKWCYCGTLLVIAAIGILIILCMVLITPSSHDDGDAIQSSSSNGNNTGQMHDHQYPPFSEDLTENARRQIMEVIGSPLYLANKWVQLDPKLDTYTKRRKLQRFFLATIYYSTGGDNWLNNEGWLDYEISECSWFTNSNEDELVGRPRCDNNDNIRILSLASNNLTGSLPAIGPFYQGAPLPVLDAFDISNNNLSGVMPTLTYRQPKIVITSNNNFNDLFAIANDVSAVKDIQIIKYDSNQLNLTFRGHMFPFFTGLEVYNITRNQIDGVIGWQISFCKNLTYLGMADNFFGSSLPSQLGELTKLEEIDVSRNPTLTGPIPSTLGALTKLARIDIRETAITGKVPDELCTRVREAALEVLANCSQVQCCS